MAGAFEQTQAYDDAKVAEGSPPHFHGLPALLPVPVGACRALAVVLSCRPAIADGEANQGTSGKHTS